jgi:hypothetical protein
MMDLNIKTLRRAAIVLTAAFATCATAQIQSYSLPKDHPAINSPSATSEAAKSLAASASFEKTSARLQWTTPSGWQEIPASGYRLGSFVIPNKDKSAADVAITSFPGQVGSERDNVNRWRAELGLAAIGENDISSQPVSIASLDGKLFDIAGEKSRTVVALLHRDGSTWFFKMRGDPAIVAAQKDAFTQFLKTIRFSEETPAPGAEPVAEKAPVAAAATTAGLPEGWVEKDPGAMILKRFAAGEATVTVSSFPGDVGGTAANVNRWRQQLGLEKVDDVKALALTDTLPLGAVKGTLVDFSGTTGSEKTRLVAVMVARDGSTWFYKLVGPSDSVEKQKAAFVSYVKTAANP